MTVLDTPAEAHKWAAEVCHSRRLALVPTMGALHGGHLELVRRARDLADAVAVSLFVNPTQFGPHEDFARYPRTPEEDRALLAAEGVEAVFAPRAEEVYPDGFRTIVEVEGLSDILEGAIRPGHFRGVATVVCKLLHIVPAHVAVFGQKDYQQLVVIRRMVRDLNMPVVVAAVATVREPDGLAMSSRNRYLSEPERRAGLALSRALGAAREAVRGGVAGQEALESAAWNVLDAEDLLVPDYAAVLDPDSLEPLDRGWKRAVCLVAGRLGATRLIDNAVFDRAGAEVAV